MLRRLGCHISFVIAAVWSVLAYTAPTVQDLLKPNHTLTADSSALTCYARRLPHFPQAPDANNCHRALLGFIHEHRSHVIKLVSEPPFAHDQLRVPWTNVVGDCQFKIDLVSPANHVWLIRDILDFAARSILIDCLEKGQVGGRFRLEEGKAFVEMRKANGMVEGGATQ